MSELIPPGQKFACLLVDGAWELKIDRCVSLSDGRSIHTEEPFAFSDNWRESLGSLFMDRLDDFYLYILATAPSKRPQVLDAENQLLETRCRALLNAIVLEGLGAEASWVLVSGANVDGAPQAQSCSGFQYIHAVDDDLNLPIPVLNAQVARTAERIAAGIERVRSDNAHFDRLGWGLNVWECGIHERVCQVRLHQFVRALEGVTKSKSKEQFASRCLLFTADSDQEREILEETYAIRSAAEHLNGPVVVFDRGSVPTSERVARLRLRCYQAERLAGLVYGRILSAPDLLERFQSDASIDRFWSMRDDERQQAWGDGIELKIVGM